MKDFTYPITKHLQGLAPVRNVRNNPYLIEAIGAVPYEGVLEAVEQFSRIDTSALTTSFPYPQLFVLSDVIVVCNQTAIYELSSSTLTLKISGLTAGVTWSLVDFKTFLYFTNGKIAVKKDSQTNLYSIDSSLPFGTALCNFNGQVFLGSPNCQASGDI